MQAAAIAVSGGADSFALLHWAWKAGKPIVALTVNHGLREGSAQEADAVAAWCRERSIDHEILIWEGEKPKTGLQATARSARYRLLCEACEKMGISHLFTAHTADDQAETVFMRLKRGGGRGLAGMPAQRMIAAGAGELITLHRPMLSVRRFAARVYADEYAVPFIDDPSNEDDKYERVRVRALLAALEQQDLLTVEALCRTAASSATRCRPSSWPGETVDGAVVFADADDLIDSASDARDRVDRIMSALGSWSSSRSPISVDALSGMTVRGVMVRAIGKSGVIFLREPAALLGRADGAPGLAPISVMPGSKHLFDRRFIVSVPEEAHEGLELRPLGQILPRDIATSTLARQRIATLPCLVRGETLTHLPEQAAEAVTNALNGWKGCDAFLSTLEGTFQAQSLFAERFAGDVIRY
ncbi:MAG: tRNA lysidine(34) synthetase TilS [Pseudomonadota bacterium]